MLIYSNMGHSTVSKLFLVLLFLLIVKNVFVRTRQVDSGVTCDQDLQCRYIWHTGYYHGLMDCILPISIELEKAELYNHKICSDIANRGKRDWIKVLAPSVVTLKTREFLRGVPGYLIPPRNCNCKKPENLYHNTSLKHRQENAEAFHRLVSRVSPLRNDPSEPIVFISRRGKTRKIKNEKQVISALRQVGRVYVFTGVENITETITIFKNAKIIVGFHGAGFVNLLFANGGEIYAYEWSTYNDVLNQSKWRSLSEDYGLDKWSTKNHTIHSKIVYLPLLDIIPDLNVTDMYASHLDTDHYIKQIEWIVIPNDEIERMKKYARNVLGF